VEDCDRKRGRFTCICLDRWRNGVSEPIDFVVPWPSRSICHFRPLSCQSIRFGGSRGGFVQNDRFGPIAFEKRFGGRDGAWLSEVGSCVIVVARQPVFEKRTRGRRFDDWEQVGCEYVLTGSRSFQRLPSSCLHESSVTSISGPIFAIAMIRSELES